MRGLGILAAGAVLVALLTSGMAAAEKVTVDRFPLVTEIGVSPKALPKRALTPVRFSFEAGIPSATANGTPVPAARQVTLRMDRNIAFDLKRFPRCRADFERSDIDAIQALCWGAIVGEGETEFDSAALSLRPAYSKPTLILNGGRRGAVRTLLVARYLTDPVPRTVVIPMRIKPIEEGRHGLEATITIADSLTETAGRLTFMRLQIGRMFWPQGKDAPVISARCPDGKLAFSATIEFADGTSRNQESVRPCNGTGQG